MKFTPKTEQAIAEEGLLKPGPYPFTITEASEKVSKKGNDMIVVELDVFGEDGKARSITDYLMESMAFKLRHFAYAVGLGARYEAGTLNAQELAGLSGKCIVKIDPPKDQYQSKNAIKDYVKQGEEPKAKPQLPGPTYQAEDQPPF